MSGQDVDGKVWKRVMPIGSFLIDKGVQLDFAAMAPEQQNVLKRVLGLKVNTSEPVTCVLDGETARIQGFQSLLPGEKFPVSFDDMKVLENAPLPAIGQMTQSAGGAANNASQGCLKFGKTPIMLSGIGENDENGKILEDIARKDGIDTGAILKKKGMGTGVSVILRYDGDRFIMTYRGASTHAEKDIPADFPERFDPDCVILSNCNNTATSLLVLTKLAGKGVNKLWVPSENDMRTLRQMFTGDNLLQAELLKHMFKQLGDSEVSCMCLNATEWGHTTDAMRETLLDAFKVIAVTNGKSGGDICHRVDGRMVYDNYKAAPTKMGFMDSTGAGDAFSLTFFFALNFFAGDVRKAVDAARCVSASIVAYDDPFSGYPPCHTAEELEAFAKDWLS